MLVYARVSAILWMCCVSIAAQAQRAELQPAPTIILPGTSDSNSPAHWNKDQLLVYQSMSLPLVSTGAGQTSGLRSRPVILNTFEHYPLWIEATWLDPDGTLYAWYHHEQWRCMTAPVIGALISHDGGYSFTDLGIVLQSGYPLDCSAGNGIFGGGHGDFTVVLDRWRQFFYFYFTNYSGPLSSQGIAVARLAYEERSRPVGRVWKFFGTGFAERGINGRITAIMPAYVSWSSRNADSFWGPSLHWNTHLEQYVMLLNRACCAPGWPQEGIYVSFNPDVANPLGWSQPVKIMEGGGGENWYPQIIGLRNEKGTDKEAGQVARFYLRGESRWRIVFDY